MSRCKTSIRRGQPNPVYKETFIFQVALFQLSDVTLMISIYNKRSMKRKEMIGWISMGQNSSGEEEQSHWQEMKESKGLQNQWLGKESSSALLLNIALSLASGKLRVTQQRMWILLGSDGSEMALKSCTFYVVNKGLELTGVAIGMVSASFHLLHVVEREELKCKTDVKKKDEKYDEKMFGYSTGRVIWVYS
ncbi:hypothetical protein CIB84_001796 [Bambusicola thoracicus]|uniref:C2 domain-containing protein n=1 Tax=Bambusicola thoracicus TaxID=9083 RepID=A0A2P4TDL9_BAMTH|nr:hypothetical protein CIB84_001796 [Bambusicola thoracicus]